MKREDLFVTSKIWLTYYRKDRVPICAKKILDALQLEYIDLLLLHWPFCMKQQDKDIFPTENNKVVDDDVDYLEAYQALEALVDQGLVRSIGVCNFNIEQIKRLVSLARIKPVINQVEFHPYLVQTELKKYCNDNGILITAYSPLCNPGSSVNLADKVFCNRIHIAIFTLM